MKGKKTIRIISRIIVVAVILALLVWWLLLKPGMPLTTQDPVENFNYGSVGNEESNGLPYWIWRVLPGIFPEYLPGNQDSYGSLGLFWEAGRELPVGFSMRSLGVIPRVSFNCALCHQGSYRLQGEHKSTLVSGGAGTRVSPQNYQRFLSQAGMDAKFNASRIMEEIKTLYDMPLWERMIYRFVLIPFTRKALNEQTKNLAWMDIKPDWGIARIDPFNPVKYGILAMPVDETIGNSDIMPLWAMDQIVNRQDKVYGLHWDGLNTNLHEVVVSGAIGDGMTYKSYHSVVDSIKMREDWIRLQQPPESPFNIYRAKTDAYYVDANSLDKGKNIYARFCADCHEVTGSKFRSVVSILDVATDRHRLDMWSKEASDRYTNYQKDTANWGFSHWQKVNGYVSPELTGLWLRGPYLHNGSVPTLNDLLKPAAQRPKQFCRGSDTVDPINGGFMAPLKKENCKGFFFDTHVPGNANVGHEYGTSLSKQDKSALLSYLKTR